MMDIGNEIHGEELEESSTHLMESNMKVNSMKSQNLEMESRDGLMVTHSQEHSKTIKCMVEESSLKQHRATSMMESSKIIQDGEKEY